MEGRVGGAQEWVPCDSIRTCHWEGFLSSSMSDDPLKPLGRDPARVHFARRFVSIPGHSTKDVVAKHSEVTRDTKAYSVQLLCDPESLSLQH